MELTAFTNTNYMWIKQSSHTHISATCTNHAHEFAQFTCTYLHAAHTHTHTSQQLLFKLLNSVRQCVQFAATTHAVLAFHFTFVHTWLWVKNRYPKSNPGKWKHGLKPAVPWLFNFDPYPHHQTHTFHTYTHARTHFTHFRRSIDTYTHHTQHMMFPNRAGVRQHNALGARDWWNTAALIKMMRDAVFSFGNPILRPLAGAAPLWP